MDLVSSKFEDKPHKKLKKIHSTITWYQTNSATTSLWTLGDDELIDDIWKHCVNNTTNQRNKVSKRLEILHKIWYDCMKDMMAWCLEVGTIETH